MRDPWHPDCIDTGTVRFFAITKPGLLAMTLSVAALWTCIAMERSTLRHAALDARACATALAELRERSTPVPSPVSSPVSSPAPFHRQLPKAS
jgi:hypothetical protein